MRLELSFRQLEVRLTNTENLLILVISSVGEQTQTIASLKESIKGNRVPKIERYISHYYITRNIHRQPPTNPKSYRRSLNSLIKLEEEALRTALEQAIVQLCIAYEEFIRKVLLRFYRDDIARLKHTGKTFSTEDIINLIESNSNIHKHMANIAIRKFSYLSVNEWHEKISKKMGIAFEPSEALNELFTLRNCVVHDGGRITADLHNLNPIKYSLGSQVEITFEDFQEFLASVHKTAKYLRARFDEKFSDQKSSWKKASL